MLQTLKNLLKNFYSFSGLSMSFAGDTSRNSEAN